MRIPGFFTGFSALLLCAISVAASAQQAAPRQMGERHPSTEARAESLPDTPPIFINEIMASNATGIEDEDGDTVPWIEIYNAGGDAIDLQHYGLSDDPDRPWRWVFPDITIAPGEFLVVFASGKNRSDPKQPLHTNFRVSSAGETISITNINGVLIDRVPPTPIPTDISFGRKPDGSTNWYYFNVPTPGAPNTTEGFLDFLDPPVFSLEGGFYTSEREIHLSSGNDNAEIRYTRDGSLPDSTSRLYEAPIRITDRTSLPNNLSGIKTSPPGGVPLVGYEWFEPEGQVFKGTVIRARAFRPGAGPSETVTHSYFVDPAGPDRYTLSVVSIVTDSLHLFDYESGIYIPGKIYHEEADGDHQIGNYFQRGMEWERPAAFELFNEQGDRVHSQNIGIRIHGGASRSVPQKSLRLYARNQYGDNRFYHQIFPDQPDQEYNRLVLRNSGQDFFARSTMFRDAFMQQLVKDFNLDTQAYRPAVIFINGEFWGIQNIRERYDDHYLSRTHDVDPDNIDLLTGDSQVKFGNSHHYDTMLSFIRDNDPADDLNYEHIKTMMDVDNFLDYIIAQVFIRNVDWPGNNIDFWRLRTGFDPQAAPGHDGRWRWLLFDTDSGFGLLNPWRVASFDMINHMTNDKHDDWPNPAWSTFLIRRLLENESFRSEFIRRFGDYLNSVFLPGNVIAQINTFENNLEPVIDEHIRRWKQIESKDRWHFNVDRMRNFAETRPGYVYQHIVKNFGLSGTADVNVDVSALHKGRVQINSLVIDEHTPSHRDQEHLYPWKGRYFRDVPVKIIARPYQGYRFSHWEGKGIESGADVTNDTLTVTLNGNISAKAVFVPADDEHVEPIPEAHILADGDYHFSGWDAGADPGTYPDNMIFQYMEEPDPGLHTPAAGFTTGAYDLTSRTRINGLGDDGFAFINTSHPDGNPGYPGGRLGGAVLAIDTRDMKNIVAGWTGGTVSPNSKVYHLRLQYRINGDGTFRDVRDESGVPVEYQRHNEAGHSRRFDGIMLPPAVNNKPYVELRWKYYFTGERLYDDTAARAQLRLNDIHITGENIRSHDGEPITDFKVLPNYPNPFNNTSVIPFYLPEEALVSIRIYDAAGRMVRQIRDNVRMAAGHHPVHFDASGLASGMYIYRVETPDWTGHGKMSLIR